MRTTRGAEENTTRKTGDFATCWGRTDAQAGFCGSHPTVTLWVPSTCRRRDWAILGREAGSSAVGWSPPDASAGLSMNICELGTDFQTVRKE